MGSKNGKYHFEHEISSPNYSETLPTYLSELHGPSLLRIFRKQAKSVPRCIHRAKLNDTLTTSRDSISVVWLDKNIQCHPSNIDTEVKLRNLMNYVRVFDRVDSCERYIKQIGRMNANNLYMNQEKLLVIISKELAVTLLPHLHDLTQVKYIYVYEKSATISKDHQQDLKKYQKVRGVLNSSRQLMNCIAQDQN